MRKLFYPIIGFFREVKKAYDWYFKALKYDYDFDGMGIYTIIGYKLERLLLHIEHGHGVPDKNTVKRIKTAIKLAYRLSSENYLDSCYEEHDKKWGELQMKTLYVEDEYSRVEFSRVNAVTPDQKAQEIIESRLCTARMEEMRKSDAELLHHLLKKYIPSWWD